jgi:hypothetical protein
VVPNHGAYNVAEPGPYLSIDKAERGCRSGGARAGVHNLLGAPSGG